jgi:hypothetical protein
MSALHGTAPTTLPCPAISFFRTAPPHNTMPCSNLPAMPCYALPCPALLTATAMLPTQLCKQTSQALQISGVPAYAVGSTSWEGLSSLTGLTSLALQFKPADKREPRSLFSGCRGLLQFTEEWGIAPPIVRLEHLPAGVRELQLAHCFVGLPAEGCLRAGWVLHCCCMLALALNGSGACCFVVSCAAVHKRAMHLAQMGLCLLPIDCKRVCAKRCDRIAPVRCSATACMRLDSPPASTCYT